MAPNLPLPLSNIWTPPQPTLVQKTIGLNGQPLHFFHPTNDDTIYGTLSCLQNDKFSLSKIKFAAGDVLLDIGSNVGLLGLVVSRLNPDVRVYAFDASDLATKAARQSVATNGFTNYLTFNKAVGDSRRKGVQFYSNGKDKSCLVAEGLNSSNPVPESTVDFVSIEDIFDSPILDIGRVKYAKFDIEGGEHSIFALLFDKRPDILDRIDYLHLEVHPYQEYKPDELIAKVKARFGDRVFFDT